MTIKLEPVATNLRAIRYYECLHRLKLDQEIADQPLDAPLEDENNPCRLLISLVLVGGLSGGLWLLLIEFVLMLAAWLGT